MLRNSSAGPATVFAGGFFFMGWQVANEPAPITQNRVAYSVGQFNLFMAKQAFADWTYS